MSKLSTELSDQPTTRPTNKVIAGTASGASGTIILVSLARFFGWEMTAEEAIGITGIMLTISNFIAMYFKRDKKPALPTPAREGIS